MAFPIVSILELVLPTIRELIPDADKAKELEAKIKLAFIANEQSWRKAVSEMVVAEANGASWMQRNWRPTMSFMVIGMWLWNYIIRPLLGLVVGPIEGIPDDALVTFSGLWASAYGIGRSMEKTGSSFSLGGRRE